MANGSFKTLGGNDIVSTRTLLHEAIPLTGTIVSGTYADANVKKHSHGMFQSVYDYPFLSSSANHIFDITAGVAANSLLYSTVTSQQKKKKNVYGQMAQILVGYDITGSVLDFDADGNILAGGDKLREVFILPMSRLLVKDEIKKETFNLEIGVKPAYDEAGALFDDRLTITDHGAASSYFVNSPAGEYGILYATCSTGQSSVGSHDVMHATNQRVACGLIYYQAGIIVVSSSIFKPASAGGILHNSHGSVLMDGPKGKGVATETVDAVLTGSLISKAGDNFRTRMYNLSFNNTTELNSTIYFCRVRHDEFNYSSNPTYLTGSKIRVKQNATMDPVSYITTIGLYSSANELMAVAKLSEPLKKTPSQEFTLRVRLDY
tara:strand:+ start:10 stop:1140 length:1131 start_codon:yes stop_codon:yes gene_type:complete